MSNFKEFLKKKNVNFTVQAYLIDALGAMAFGLFASLLIGTIFGTVAGALLLGMIKNALIVIKVSTYWIDAITGGMILAAMLISTYQQIRKKKELERGLV